MLEKFQAQLIRKEEQRLATLSGTGTFWLLIILTLALLGLSVRLFGEQNAAAPPLTSGTPSPSEEVRVPRVYTVSYRNGVFSPTNLRIHSGDTVRFRNDGLFLIRIASDPHPGHNDLAGFDSIGEIPPGSYFAFTFAAKGVFGYHNERDVKETGTIIVR